jgi:hypothetical protein
VTATAKLTARRRPRGGCQPPHRAAVRSMSRSSCSCDSPVIGLARNGPSGGVARTVEWPRGAYREGLLHSNSVNHIKSIMNNAPGPATPHLTYGNAVAVRSAMPPELAGFPSDFPPPDEDQSASSPVSFSSFSNAVTSPAEILHAA